MHGNQPEPHLLPSGVTFPVAYLLPQETRSPMSSEEEGWAVKFHLEAHIHSTESVQHASLWVRNPTSPIVGGGENYMYHSLYVLEATNSGGTFSCSWIQSPAFELCAIPQCLSGWEKKAKAVLMAVPPPWPPDGVTHHHAQDLPLLDPLLGLPWHSHVCCWAVTRATVTGWAEK